MCGWYLGEVFGYFNDLIVGSGPWEVVEIRGECRRLCLEGRGRSGGDLYIYSAISGGVLRCESVW